MIRNATPADAPAIATLHAESWRAAYRGILPDTYLDHEAAADRLRYWQGALAAPRPGSFVLVSSGEGLLRGFVSVTRPGEPGYDATIDNLHVRPGMRGGSIGRRLLGRAAARLIAEGATSAALRVFDANTRAIRFYRRLGGIPDAQGIDRFAGANAPDTRMGWIDLTILRDACSQG